MDAIYIKGREIGKRAWWFVTGNANDGGMNRLRVHAGRYDPSKIDAAVRILREDNPRFEFKLAK
jgi:hypothetical protein